MKVLGVQAVQSTPESLLLLDSPAMGTSGTEEGRGVGALFLHIGQPPALAPQCFTCIKWRCTMLAEINVMARNAGEKNHVAVPQCRDRRNP